MAVYTKLHQDQITDFLAQYDGGDLLNSEGILQGVENSNYKITTSRNKFILTIFEQRTNSADLPFFFDYMAHLHGKGIMCPFVIADKTGERIQKIVGKSASLFSFLEGHNLAASDVTALSCFEMGELLARMHLAAQNFKLSRVNSMSLPAWQALFEKISTVIPAKAGIQEVPIALDPVFQRDGDNDLLQLITHELEIAKTTLSLDLPKAVCHLDAFPDNIFKIDGKVWGVIDFYFSATDFLIYDLAITINSWCFETGIVNKERFDKFIEGYQSMRALSAEEKNHFSAIARTAALRILMTRLHDFIFHDPAHLVTPKDPFEYQRILEFHRDNKIFG